MTAGGVSYRVAEAAAVLGVSDDTLRRWIDAGRVAATAPPRDDEATRGPATRIRGEDLADLARTLAEQGPAGLGDPRGGHTVSARNRMRGVVTRVVKDTVMAQVEMVCGPYRIVSLMSAEAATELGLVPGVIAIASVKSTNVVVETA